MRLVTLVLVFVVGLHCLAGEVEEVVFEGTSKNSSRPVALKEIGEAAVRDVSLRFITDLIGEAKTRKNFDVIRTKILRKSRRYILLVKNGELKKDGQAYRMTVRLKLSTENLREMLLIEGLLYKLDGPPKVVPLIRVSDRVHSEGFSWWASGGHRSSKLVGLLNETHVSLSENLYERGFYGVRPVKALMGQMVPEIFAQADLRKEDFMSLGFLLGGAVVILGEIRFEPYVKLSDAYKIIVNLEAIHTGSGRVIGEVIRSFQTPMGEFSSVVRKKLKEVVGGFSKDLTVQMKDAWNKGVFDASLLKLSLKGRLNYHQLELVKSQFKKIRQIKALKERFFGNDLVVFEVDTSVGVDDLAKKLVAQQVQGVRLTIDEIQNYGLSLKVKMAK